MKRFLRRSACAGFMRICNAVDGAGKIVPHWYYIKIGPVWFPFDIRDLVARSKQPGPTLCEGADLTEAMLQKDLNSICAWCVRVSAQDFLERKKW